MEIIKYVYGQTKPSKKGLAVALGFFDGVHLGHRRLLRELKEKAELLGLEPCVFTFESGLRKTKNIQTILYNNEDKTQIFKALGISTVIFADFDSISGLSPEEFVNEVLIRDFDVKIAIAGFNFRFGKRASGDSDTLVKMMSERGCEAFIVDEQSLDGQSLSSTLIRGLLSEGRTEEANRLLGSPYFIRGRVERGLGLGAHFGFPTVNTPISETSPLKTGVYRAAVKIGEKLYTGITNVGECPTVKAREIHAETLIADFCGDLYGKEIYIYLLEYLREERNFGSVELLREQIYRDRDVSKTKNGDLKWLEIGLSSP